MDNVAFVAGKDHSDTDSRLKDGDYQGYAPSALTDAAVKHVADFNDGETDEDGTNDGDELRDAIVWRKHDVGAGKEGDDALEYENEPVTFNIPLFVFGVKVCCFFHKRYLQLLTAYDCKAKVWIFQWGKITHGEYGGGWILRDR